MLLLHQGLSALLVEKCLCFLILILDLLEIGWEGHYLQTDGHVFGMDPGLARPGPRPALSGPAQDRTRRRERPVRESPPSPRHGVPGSHPLDEPTRSVLE